jgi:hypothetical protein
MIQIHTFIEKEKEGGEGRPQLGGQWKVPMFGGSWKIPMFGGLWKEKEKHHFDLFSLSPLTHFIQIFFPIDFKVLLYHGSRPLLYTFLSFSLTYKLQPCILMYQVLHTFIAKLILTEDFFLSLNSWHCA